MTQQAKALTIDRQEKRLYWVQLRLPGESAVASCDYDGNGLHILDVPLEWAFCCIVIPPFAVSSTKQIAFVRFHSVGSGISVFLQHIFYTDDTFGVIKRVNKHTGEETLKVNIKPMVKAPVALKVVHHLNQPMADASAPGCTSSFLMSISTKIKHSKRAPTTTSKQVVIPGVGTVWACVPLSMERVSALKALLSVSKAPTVKVSTRSNFKI